jgi:hypothetical protein
LNVCTHDCKSLWIKASAKWHILLLLLKGSYRMPHY